jgi:two-component system, NarL family, sensor histidine kinase UhpB
VRSFDREAAGALDTEPELVLYRVAQESLTKVVRHAQATRAEVDVHCTGTSVVLSVTDDGRGLGSTPPRLDGGVRGMRERVTVGGRLELEQLDPHGVRVTLRLPAMVRS